MTERRSDEKSEKPKIPRLPILSSSVSFLLALAFVNWIVIVSGIATEITYIMFAYCLVVAGLSTTFRLFWNDFADRKNNDEEKRR